MWPGILIGGLIGSGAFGLGWLLWRQASRRRHLPCPAWLAWMVELDNPLARENRAARIVAHLAVTPGMRVLDAGCGPGRLALPLAAATGNRGELVALDAQEAMTSIVLRKAHEQGFTNVRPLTAPLGPGVLPPDHFDRAVLVTVLGEIPDQAAALAELFRSLKPGGILAITETLFDPHCVDRTSVRRLAVAAGFRPVASYGNRLASTLLFAKGPDVAATNPAPQGQT